MERATLQVKQFFNWTPHDLHLVVGPVETQRGYSQDKPQTVGQPHAKHRELRTMRIIPFSLKYKPQCIALFEDNTPVYFAPEEKEIFDNFLDRQNPPYQFYLVKSDNNLIIACGGIKEDLGKGSAMLRWDIVKSDQQKHGIGSFLTKYRIARICEKPGINIINLGTSQKTFSFYEKMGFQLKSIKKDGIAPGLDEYYMEQEITDELRSKFAKY